MREIVQPANAASISQRIARNSATVAQWAATCLKLDPNAVCGIAELYAAYEAHCYSEHWSPLPRKVWVAAMKLAEFETESGAFVGLAARD